LISGVTVFSQAFGLSARVTFTRPVSCVTFTISCVRSRTIFMDFATEFPLTSTRLSSREP
jgi:hypothetical protein